LIEGAVKRDLGASHVASGVWSERKAAVW